jgi:putative radical SAM enzyme (TIGR03279 family)
MAPKFRRTLYIKDDDYRYSFLFGHFVTLTNLNEHDWWKIEEMRLSPLYISVHVTDLQKRRQFLRNPSAPDILPQIRSLTEKGIQLHTQLVIVPEFNDGPILERSIRDLAMLYPAVKSISVVPVGLTRHHKYQMRTHTPEEAGDMLDYLSSFQEEFKQSLSQRFVYPTDEWYLVAGRSVPKISEYDGHDLHENGLGMVRNFLDEWQTLKSEIKSWMFNFENRENQSPEIPGMITLVTGTLFAPILKKIASEFQQLTGIKTQVFSIVNDRLGDSITVAGLLMGVDVLSQLKETVLGNIVVLPRVMFDHPETISLDDMPPQTLANELRRSIVLADSMGDVWDAVTGASISIYR